MEPVRAGLVGVGWWGGELARGARASGLVDVTACYSRTPESRDRFAAEHGMRPVADYRHMLEDPELDAILVVTPHSTHAELVVAACEAGKHVFVEKPLTLSVDEGRRCVDAAADAGVTLQVGHQRRRQPANRRIRSMIDAGEMGTVVALEANFSSPGGAGRADPDNWRQDPAERPLSGLTPFGVHVIDTFHSFVGPVTEVSALGTRPVGVTGLDDAAVLGFRFGSGAVGTLLTSTTVPATNRVGVLGTEAAAWNERDSARLLVQRSGEREPREVALEELDVIADQLGEFGRCVRTGARPEVDGEAGLAVAAVVEAALRAAATGGTVAVGHT
ncbi:MAG TPA: Gfo/Idh/MocA family oxidoreductase [Acidimicrobiia bacterium]